MAGMLHPQHYPGREGRIEIWNEELGHGAVERCTHWRNPD
jgi:hypothetical protein